MGFPSHLLKQDGFTYTVVLFDSAEEMSECHTPVVTAVPTRGEDWPAYQSPINPGESPTEEPTDTVTVAGGCKAREQRWHEKHRTEPDGQRFVLYTLEMF